MQEKLAHKQYTNVHISTIDRGRLLLMMYDGLLKFLRHCADGLDQKDVPKFARFLSKSQAIVSELSNTLDHEAGGIIAHDLERLYDFMMYYLTEANLEKSAKKVRMVSEIVQKIASAYRDIIEGKKNPDTGNKNLESNQQTKDENNKDSGTTPPTPIRLAL